MMMLTMIQTAIVLAIKEPWVVGCRLWGHTKQSCAGQ